LWGADGRSIMPAHQKSMGKDNVLLPKELSLYHN